MNDEISNILKSTWYRDYSGLANAALLYLFANYNNLPYDDEALKGEILDLNCVLKFAEHYNLRQCFKHLFTPTDLQGILLDTYKSMVINQNKDSNKNAVCKVAVKAPKKLLTKLDIQKAIAETKRFGVFSKSVMAKIFGKVQNKLQTNFDPKNDKKEDHAMNSIEKIQSILKPVLDSVMECCPTDDTREINYTGFEVKRRRMVDGCRMTIKLNDGINRFTYWIITEDGEPIVTIELKRTHESATVIDVIQKFANQEIAFLIASLCNAKRKGDTEYLAAADSAMQDYFIKYKSLGNLHDDDEEPMTIDSMKEAAKKYAASAKDYADDAFSKAKNIYTDKVPYEKRRDIKRAAGKANKVYQAGKKTALSMLYKAAKSATEKLDKYSNDNK